MKKILTFIAALALAAQAAYAAPRKPIGISYTVKLKYDYGSKCKFSYNILFRGNKVFVESDSLRCGIINMDTSGTGEILPLNGKSSLRKRCQLTKGNFTCDDGTNIVVRLARDHQSDIRTESTSRLRDGFFEYEIIVVNDILWKGGKKSTNNISTSVKIELSGSECNVSQYNIRSHTVYGKTSDVSTANMTKQLKCEVFY